MDVTALRFLTDRALKAVAKLDEAKSRKQEEKVRLAKKEDEAEAHLQAVYFIGFSPLKYGIFRPPSSWTLRPWWRGRRETPRRSATLAPLPLTHTGCFLG